MAVGIQIAGVYKVEDILPGMVNESLREGGIITGSLH